MVNEMNLVKVATRGLFGRFDHVIPFDVDSHITIITAPNGYGKTVILNIINDFFSKNFASLSKHHFSEVLLSFDNDYKVLLTRHGRLPLLPDEKSFEEEELVVKPINIDSAETWVYRFDSDIGSKRLGSVERYVPFLTRIGQDKWVDERDGRFYSAYELIYKYSDDLPPGFRDLPKIPEWLENIIGKTECHLIETERLFQIDRVSEYRSKRGRANTDSVVERNAYDLARRIGETLQSYANQSQKLDQSFPKRLLTNLGREAPSEEAIRARLQGLDSRRAQFVEAGLLDRSFSPPITAEDVIPDNTIRAILSEYADGTEEKLAVFDDIYKKIDLFKEIINSHFTFKEVSANSDAGIFISDESGKPVPLDSLSSGEKHELVLLYDLLFKVSDEALILIDEPELSLHVAWQKRFISDLEKIQQLRPIRIVMATHSPQIINDRWELTVELSR